MLTFYVIGFAKKINIFVAGPLVSALWDLLDETKIYMHSVFMTYAISPKQPGKYSGHDTAEVIGRSKIHQGTGASFKFFNAPVPL